MSWVISRFAIITSGGATTFLDLALYLVERFAGRERANAAARVLLIEGARTSQLPYATLGALQRDHDNDLVHRAQDLIDADLGGPLHRRARQSRGVKQSDLSRRFQDTLGRGPQAYIQLRRIVIARRLLETTDNRIDNIRSRVDYRDPTAFRRAFRHYTGLSPGEYRNRYGWPITSTHQHPSLRRCDTAGRNA